MKLFDRFAGILVGLVAGLPSAGWAQSSWTPGSEIIGQPVQVTTNGIVNIVTLNPDGSAGITAPDGTVMSARWSASPGQLCLSTAAQECFPFNAPLQPGQPLTMTSSCNSTSTWLAQATNQPPTQNSKSERGR